MSQETLTWLNKNVLVGFTEKRGNAWHYKASEQGEEPNHYPGAIPLADVERRLFHWDPLEVPVHATIPAEIGTATGVDEAGNPVRTVTWEGHKAVVRSDTGDVLGVFSSGYQPHHYQEWLAESVASRLAGDLGIGSAGLLKGGAQAWCQVEVPETVSTKQGVDFRPNLLACDSLDGSLASTYKRTVTVTVCDNTLSASLRELGEQVKVKHSRYSHLRLDDVRATLGLLEQTAELFSETVRELTEWKVSTREWSLFLDGIVPVPETGSKQAVTLSTNKRDALNRLYRYDNRCAPWYGTAFGVLQATNTYLHHESNIRGVERAERNMSNVALGVTEKADTNVLTVLRKVAAAAQ